MSAGGALYELRDNTMDNHKFFGHDISKFQRIVLVVPAPAALMSWVDAERGDLVDKFFSRLAQFTNITVVMTQLDNHSIHGKKNNHEKLWDLMSFRYSGLQMFNSTLHSGKLPDNFDVLSGKAFKMYVFTGSFVQKQDNATHGRVQTLVAEQVNSAYS